MSTVGHGRDCICVWCEHARGNLDFDGAEFTPTAAALEREAEAAREAVTNPFSPARVDYDRRMRRAETMLGLLNPPAAPVPPREPRWLANGLADYRVLDDDRRYDENAPAAHPRECDECGAYVHNWRRHREYHEDHPRHYDENED